MSKVVKFPKSKDSSKLLYLQMYLKNCVMELMKFHKQEEGKLIQFRSKQGKNASKSEPDKPA